MNKIMFKISYDEDAMIASSNERAEEILNEPEWFDDWEFYPKSLTGREKYIFLRAFSDGYTFGVSDILKEIFTDNEEAVRL